MALKTQRAFLASSPALPLPHQPKTPLAYSEHTLPLPHAFSFPNHNSFSSFQTQFKYPFFCGNGTAQIPCPLLKLSFAVISFNHHSRSVN